MTFGRWYSKEKSELLLCWHSWRMETRFVLLRIYIFLYFCHKISFSILGLLSWLLYLRIFDPSVTKLPLFILTTFQESVGLRNLVSGFDSLSCYYFSSPTHHQWIISCRAILVSLLATNNKQQTHFPSIFLRWKSNSSVWCLRPSIARPSKIILFSSYFYVFHDFYSGQVGFLTESWHTICIFITET